MHKNDKQAILAKLAQTKGEDSEKILRQQYGKISSVFEKSIDVHELQTALDLLETFVFRFPEEAVIELVRFITRLNDITLTFPANSTLQVAAIGVLTQVRYLAQKKVTEALFELSTHQDYAVRKASLEGLNKLVVVDYHVFSQIGLQPQLELLEKVKNLSDEEINVYSEALFSILPHFFDSNMSGSEWGYNEVKFISGTIPGEDKFQNYRNDALEMAIDLYSHDEDIGWKLRILNALNNAARFYSKGAENVEALLNIIEENSLRVLKFFKELITTEKLQIIQNIENYSYWIFYHTNSDKVASSALEIHDKLKTNEEYNIYRDLIGFKGIFGNWDDLKTGKIENYLSEEEKRKRVSKWINSIDQSNFLEWQFRILNYIQTESNDLATFPNFYIFLEKLAEKYPELMLSFLQKEEEALQFFMIPILKGIWNSSVKSELLNQMEKWIDQKKHLYACAKMFLTVDDFDKRILKKVLVSAIKLQDVDALIMVLVVAIKNIDQEKVKTNFIIPILKELTILKNSDWIKEIWFRPYRKKLFEVFDENEIEVVLDNLLWLNQIDHEGEEILTLVAKKHPLKVVKFFGERLQKSKETEIFDAIPFQFQELHKIFSSHAVQVIKEVRTWHEGDDGLYSYRGPRFLSLIFPDFPDEFENELLTIVVRGNEEDIKFVLSILRNYEGQIFLHKVCREIVISLPKDHSLLNEVMIILESTGVVSGEYGRALAYERKIKEIEYWLEDENSNVREFSKHYVEILNQQAAQERERVDEEIALRKYEYGIVD